jgi:hypothetical protein
MKIAATIISALGYVLAIWGGSILYSNTAPEQLEGTIPKIDASGDEPDKAFERFFAKQEAEIESREKGSRRGFLLLTIGSVLQLVGTVLGAFG